MEGRVPGGRKCSLSGDDLSTDEIKVQYDASVSNQGSKSLPRYPNIAKDHMNDVSEKLKAKTFVMESVRKSKLSNSLSFASIMKNMKKLSTSVNTNSPKMQKKSKGLNRSKSLNRKGGYETVNSGDQEIQKVNEGIVCFEGDNIPGLVGLKNHGNTCFMNAVLQCLSNTELLSEYFVTDQYKQDIRGKSKYNAKKYGTKGELTQHLARLLKSLWMRQYSPAISSDLKAIVGKYGPQYRGYSQHDAQEFLLWLLDKIHEDLNIAAKKKYKANKTIHGRADDQAAAEALANHTRCNNSYVYDLFQALYKSSLTCPHCSRQSNTFDPFLSVSLPIPQRSKKAIFVTVVYLDAHPKQVRIGLLLDPADTVKELRQTLACDTNISPQQLILTEIYYDGFHRTFNDSQPLSDLREADNIYALETLQSPEAESEEGGETESAGEAGYISLVLLNKLSGQNQPRRFGGPFVLQIPREISYTELHEEILHSMSSMLKDGFLAQFEEQEQKSLYFQLKLLDGMQAKKLLSAEVEHPLFTESVERALSLCVPGGGPEHIKMLVEWDPVTKQSVVGNSEDSIEEHSSVKQASQQSQKPVVGNLDECFRTYTQEERLECDNLWLCPNCRQKQQGTTKAISLWSLPDVLIIHLKRFRQTSVNRTKVDTLISFPLTDLDMSQHVAKKPSGVQSANKGVTGWSPWRPNRKTPTAPEDYIYDLYGVCNHFGNMQGGHYTAFCQSPATGKWYTFDDTKVTEMKEEDVVSRAAYLLFYKRRTANTTTVYQQDHWLHSVAKIKFIEPQTRHSQSHEDLLDDHRVHQDDTFTRSTNPYATLRSPTHASSTSPPPPHSRGGEVEVSQSDDTKQQQQTDDALVGSPSMGSLGLVDMCNEPMRKVRNDSEHSQSSPSGNNNNGRFLGQKKSPIKQQQPHHKKPSSTQGANLNNVVPRYVTNVTVGNEKEAMLTSPGYRRSAPRAQPESFDSSRSPSINSHDSPQNQVPRKVIQKLHLQQHQQSQRRLQEVRVYNNLGRHGNNQSTGSTTDTTQHSFDSSDESSSHASMEQALNEQKLVSLLESPANHPSTAPRLRRQLPKTPETPRAAVTSGSDGHILSHTGYTHIPPPPSSPFHQRQQHLPHNQKVLSHVPLTQQNGTVSPGHNVSPASHSKGAHHRQTHAPPPVPPHAMQQVDSLSSSHPSLSSPPTTQAPTAGDKMTTSKEDEYYRTVRRDKEKTPDKELQTWDYKQTVYLQESCV